MTAQVSIFEDTAAEELLRRLERDGNLRHSGPRWLAVAAAYPDVNPGNAREIAESYAKTDAARLVEFRALHEELVEKAPMDVDLIAYCAWAIGLLEHSLAEFHPDPNAGNRGAVSDAS